MAKSFTSAGSLKVPAEDVVDSSLATFLLNAGPTVYTQKANDDLVYDEAVADEEISFGTMAESGAKLLLVKCPIGACTIKLNDVEAEAVPLAPGGWLFFYNPSEAFFTKMFITTTDAAQIIYLALA